MRLTRAYKAALCSGGSLVALTVPLFFGAAEAQTPQAPSVIGPQVKASQSQKAQASETPPAQATVTASADQPAGSQEPAATSSPGGQIVVTGFRASLHNALSDK